MADTQPRAAAFAAYRSPEVGRAVSRTPRSKSKTEADDDVRATGPGEDTAVTLSVAGSPAPVEYDVEPEEDVSGEVDLRPDNVGAGRSCCPCGVRSIVSKKKRRFIEAGVNLDLSYITNRVIAMGYPSAGLEALYRNPHTRVRAFLDSRHGGHYRVWNLCCEREYAPRIFGPDVIVERFSWADHTPPPLALMQPCMASMASFLGAHPENVIAIHCKAGKGRTGTIIAAFLVHARLSRSADEGCELFGWRRTTNGKGVTIPSQHRYVNIYAMQVAASALLGGQQQAPAGIGGASPRGAAGAAPLTPAPAASAAPLTPAPAARAAAASTGPSAAFSPPQSDGRPLLSSAAANSSAALGAGSGPATGRLLLCEPSIAAAASAGSAISDGAILTVAVERDALAAAAAAAGPLPQAFSIAPGHAASHPPGTIVIDSVYGSTAAGSVAGAGSAAGAGGAETPLPVPAVAADAHLPLASLLASGDVLLSINGIEASGGRGFDEVASLLRAAPASFTVRVARRGVGVPRAPVPVPAAAASAAAASGPSGGAAALPVASAAGTRTTDAPGPVVSPGEYLSRVAGGIGLWAAAPGIDTNAVPAPPVQLLGVHLSHVPRLKIKGGAAAAPGGRLAAAVGASQPIVARSAAASDAAADAARGMYIQLYGGPCCRSLLWDSRRVGAAGAASGSAGAAASHELVGAGKDAAPAGAASAASTAASAPSFGDVELTRTGAATLTGAAASAGASTAGATKRSASPRPKTPTSAAAAGAAAEGDAAGLRSPSDVPVVGASEGQALIDRAAVSWSSEALFPRSHASGSSGSGSGSSGSGAAAVVLAGDFRIVFFAPGHRKPFAALWLHTGALPLPTVAIPRVRAAIARLPPQLPAGRGGEAEPAADGAPRLRAASGSGGTASAAAAAVAHAAYRTPGTVARVPSGRPPATAGAAGVATQAAAAPSGLAVAIPGPVLPARGPITTSPESRQLLSDAVWLGPDVPGCVIGRGVPLLGALYTASGTYVPHLPIQAASAGAGAAGSSAGVFIGSGVAASASTTASTATADGVVFFAKRNVDGAIKDKKHKAFPADFAIAISFRALALPPEFSAAV